MKIGVVVAILAVAGMPAMAHRLDEYLQGTILTIEKDRVQGQMTLTPGVAVFPFVMAAVDRDADGVISPEEQRAYAASVLGDVSLGVDGTPVAVRLLAARFPSVDEMKEGQGEIQLDFAAELPRGGRHRKLTFENRHLSGIAAYQVNSLVPRDPDLRIAAQRRNYSQSTYEVDYENGAAALPSLLWAFPIAMLLVFRLPFWWRERGWTLAAKMGDTRPLPRGRGSVTSY
jgi:hypothetical protein